MKKSLSVVAILLTIIALLPSLSEADEITFCSIPWGSDPFAVERVLDQIGLLAISSVDSSMILYDARVENTDMDSGLWGGPATEKVCGFIASGMDIMDSRDKYYDGLPVSMISGYCVYGTNENDGVSKIKPDAKLYAVQISVAVENVTETYTLLTEEYKEKYGEYEEKWGYSQIVDWDAGIMDKCDMVSRIFHGENETCAMLEKLIYKGTDRAIMISFGKLGFDEKIKRVEAMID